MQIDEKLLKEEDFTAKCLSYLVISGKPFHSPPRHMDKENSCDSPKITGRPLNEIRPTDPDIFNFAQEFAGCI